MVPDAPQVFVYIDLHMLGRQFIPYIPWRPTHCNPVASLRTIRWDHAPFPIINGRRNMNPVGRVFRIRFASLETDAYLNLFASARTGFNCIRKRNYVSNRAIKYGCWIAQIFQFSLYPANAVKHNEGYATCVGPSGMATNRSSSRTLTPSFEPYRPLSPIRR